MHSIYYWYFIAGPLDPPGYLMATFITVNTMAISWVPPYTLIGITISHYVINITVFIQTIDSDQFTTSKQPPLFTNETSLSVDVANSETCTLYETCVQAETEAGLGKKNCIRKSKCLGIHTLA